MLFRPRSDDLVILVREGRDGMDEPCELTEPRGGRVLLLALQKSLQRLEALLDSLDEVTQEAGGRVE